MNDRHPASKRVAVNAAANYLRSAVTLVVLFLLTPLVVQSLGPQQYGLWVLIISIISYFELMDCGLATATVKFIGQYEGAEDRAARNRLVSTLLAAYLAIAAVVLMLAAAAGPLVAGWFPPGLRHQALLTFAILTGKAAMELPLALFVGVLFGRQRICLISVVRAASTVAYGLAAWAVLSRGGGLASLAAVHAGVSLLEHAALLAACFLTTPGLRLRPRLVDLGLLRNVAAFSGFALLTNVASTALLRADPIVIKLFLPLSMIAVYGVAMKIAEQLLTLTKQGLNAFTPLLAQLHGAGDSERIRDVLLLSGKYAVMLMMAVAVPAACWAGPTLRLWVGPDYAAAGPLIAVLAAAMTVRIAQESATNVLAMTGGHRFVAVACVGSALLNVAVSLALAPAWGLLGVALGTLISAAATAAVVIRRACRQCGVTAAAYWDRSVGPALRAGTLQVCFCLLLRRLASPADWAALAGLYAAGAGSMLLAFWIFALDQQERRAAVERLASLVRLPAAGQAAPTTVSSESKST